MATFAVFGGAFLVRPIGGSLFGWLGDKYGRKLALRLSLIIMGTATSVLGKLQKLLSKKLHLFLFFLGLLPSYDRIGIWAPILLVILRLFQGISVGGQLIGFILYTLGLCFNFVSFEFMIFSESVNKDYGKFSAYVMMSANMGGYWNLLFKYFVFFFLKIMNRNIVGFNSWLDFSFGILRR